MTCGETAAETVRRGLGVPAVTVVIAAYDAEATIAEAVTSVLSQTRPDWELVIVDDGSRDSTADRVREAAGGDARVRIVSQRNAGTASARNHGFAHASAGWICFLDADDMLEPVYAERMLAAAGSHPDYDIFSCNADYLLRDGRRRPVWAGSAAHEPHSLTAEDQMRESSILLMSLVRREVFERVGGFRSLHSEDYDFWLRALVTGARHRYVPDTLAVYRRHEGSKTTSLVAEAESFLQILRDAREMPEMTETQRRLCDDAIEFAKARVGRRHLEQALLDRRYAGARAAYWKHRRAFPDRMKYIAGLALMLFSPPLYGRIKSGRMI